MRNELFVGVALAALIAPGAAFAQSSGTIAAEENAEIVVTGARARGSMDVTVPDTPKARTVIGNDALQTASPGQTVLQAINLVPSVNFTNNDPSGASGGNVRIRGFDVKRRSKGTPDRRRRGTPFSDNMMLVC